MSQFPNIPIFEFYDAETNYPPPRPPLWFQLCFHYNSFAVFCFVFLPHECLMKHRQLRFSATEHDDENTPRRREIQDSMFKKKNTKGEVMLKQRGLRKQLRSARVKAF